MYNRRLCSPLALVPFLSRFTQSHSKLWSRHDSLRQICIFTKYNLNYRKYIMRVINNMELVVWSSYLSELWELLAITTTKQGDMTHTSWLWPHWQWWRVHVDPRSSPLEEQAQQRFSCERQCRDMLCLWEWHPSYDKEQVGKRRARLGQLHERWRPEQLS